MFKTWFRWLYMQDPVEMIRHDYVFIEQNVFVMIDQIMPAKIDNLTSAVQSGAIVLYFP